MPSSCISEVFVFDGVLLFDLVYPRGARATLDAYCNR